MPLRVTKKCMGYVNVYLIFWFELCYFQEPSVCFPDSVFPWCVQVMVADYTNILYTQFPLA